MSEVPTDDDHHTRRRGQVGRILDRNFHAKGQTVTVLSRSPRPAKWLRMRWDGLTPGALVSELGQSDVCINLAGKSVHCRYNAEKLPASSFSFRNGLPRPATWFSWRSSNSGAGKERRRMDEFLVYYDDQCEVCQAGISWLQFLDRRHLVRPIALSSATLPAGLLLEDCLRELHVVTTTQTLVGWDAVARLARLFGWTWLIGLIGGVPPFSWLGRILYRYVARNRYAVSRCRGGACGSTRPAEAGSRAVLGAFWTCRSVGFDWRLPLVVGAWVLWLGRNLRAYVRTFRRRLTLLDGRLTLLFIGSPMADLVPLIFGERFWAVFYDGVAIDPGSSKMRNCLRR